MPYGMLERGGRRQRHPLTADVVYSDEELDFLKAIDRWKRDNDWRTPNCAEVLGIARALGYEKHPGEGHARGRVHGNFRP